VTVHRIGCPTIQTLKDEERFIEVSWEAEVIGSYPVEILVEGYDRPGLFADVMAAIANVGSNISKATAEADSDGIARISAKFDIHDLDELKKLVADIRRIKGIISVDRAFGARR